MWAKKGLQGAGSCSRLIRASRNACVTNNGGGCAVERARAPTLGGRQLRFDQVRQAVEGQVCNGQG